jgi:hypothetical protein
MSAAELESSSAREKRAAVPPSLGDIIIKCTADARTYPSRVWEKSRDELIEALSLRPLARPDGQISAKGDRGGN